MDVLIACRHCLLTRIDVRILIIIPLSVVLTFFFGYSVFRIIAQCTALACGYFVTTYLVACSKRELLWNFFEHLLGEKLTTDDAVCDDDIFTNDNSKETRCLPWKDVNIPESVNKLLEELIEQLIDNYVNSWYKTKISDDTAFVNELRQQIQKMSHENSFLEKLIILRYQIRYAVTVLYLRIRKISLTSIILFKAVPLAAVHCDRANRSYAAVDKSVYPPQMIEAKILESMPDLHFALGSRQNEVDYLRQLAEHVVGLVVDESRIAGHSSDNDFPLRETLTNHSRPWPSHVCRHFIREFLVFSFFLPLMDLVADPDTINRTFIFLFDSNVLSYRQMFQGTKQVEILHGLTDYSLNDTPDSLLQLKLSDMLRDTRQLLILRRYLRDIHAPLNELDFLLHSGDAHERMLSIQNNNAAMSELHYDVWEIFSKYIHQGSEEKVNLPSEMTTEFGEAVEKHDLEMLDRCLEKAYQIVYKRMQYEYVVPFCQSECFLGHLCGSPPFSVDKLMTFGEDSNSNHCFLPAVESNFSLTQFRNRFWRMVLPATVDGMVDSSLDQMNDVISQNVSEVADSADDIALAFSCGRSKDGEQLTTTVSKNAQNDTEERNEEVLDVQTISSLDDEMVEHQTSSSNSCEILVFDTDRDMSRWMVTIPCVEPRRDHAGGHTIYVYVISIERFDIKCENEHSVQRMGEVSLMNWSVVRRYNEFYILEAKLLEFHGNTIKMESLPSRRPFNVKSRAYVESQREHFERFIQLLTKQPALKRSDLLFAFLTSEHELKDTTQISDLYLWNVVRKMPSKFGRERGQNLRPFILSLLATTLAPRSHTSHDCEITLKRNECSDTNSISFNPEVPNRARKTLQSDIYGNNCSGVQINLSCTKNTIWTRSLFDATLFIAIRLFGVVRWPLWIMVFIRHIMRDTIDAIAAVLFKRFLNGVFVESNCIRMVQFIQDSIFGVQSPPTTDKEKMLRMELAQRLMLEYLHEQLPTYLIKTIGKKQFRHGIQTIFRVLQYPRLNKQLSYVYLDVLIGKLFPSDDGRTLRD